MILLRVLRSNPRILQYSLIRRSISSKSNASPAPDSPKPRSLSSLFSASRRTATPQMSQISKSPSTEIKKFPISSSFAAKSTTKLKLPNKGVKKKVVSARRSEPAREKEFFKELSPEAAMLLSRLIGDGYLKAANFAEGEEKLEPHKIPDNHYSRQFLKSAAESFGRKHQEVAKWLSGSDLKKVAGLGCPSTERRSVFAAKNLRAFFRIEENIVCRGCKLKTSCKFTNKRVGTMNKVVLEDVMRLIIVYALDSIPVEMVIPNELKDSVRKLVKEALSLSH